MEILTPEYGLIIWTTLSLVAFISMSICIYSILTNEFNDNKTKLIWLIGVIFLPIVGPLVYFKNKKKIINHL
jgi:ABC-type transport system involved in cytochrome bd biosynthesis fused ATPase/permease subunit